MVESGTSSRVVSRPWGQFTVWIIVQANFGQRKQLTVAGVQVGQELNKADARQAALDPKLDREQGSIIVTIATDAPLLPHSLTLLNLALRRRPEPLTQKRPLLKPPFHINGEVFKPAQRSDIDLHVLAMLFHDRQIEQDLVECVRTIHIDGVSNRPRRWYLRTAV